MHFLRRCCTKLEVRDPKIQKKNRGANGGTQRNRGVGNSELCSERVLI